MTRSKAFADRYRVDTLVSDTGRIALYRGTNVVLDRPVLIKTAAGNDINSDDFAVEAKQISRVSHPNVLQLWDFGQDADGEFFSIYEDFDGGAVLDGIVTERPQLPVELAVWIAQAIAAGVSASGIRGGLRPANVLVRENGSQTPDVKIFNFTPAAASVDGDEQNYIAPELAAGVDPDERSDVYSLGATLYRLLAGLVPFPEDSSEAVMTRLGEGPPAPLASFRKDLPPNLEAVVLKAMSLEPGMRQQTLSQFSDELAVGAVGAGAIATVSTNNIWKTAFVVLAGITLLAAALIYATSVKQTDPPTQLATDANGLPVQPINPATGLAEDNFSNMQGMTVMDANSNANIGPVPGTLPGGDGYDPWARGGMPPPGSPAGNVVTIDPNNLSPFMPSDVGCVMQPSGIMLCPVPLSNANVAVPKATPTPRRSNAANANVQPSPSPQATPAARPPNPAANTAPANRSVQRRTPAANSAPPRGTPPEDESN